MKFSQNDPKYFLYLDLIGRELYAKKKKANKSWSQFRYIGTVVGESRNVLKIKKSLHSKQDCKQFIKDHYIFRCWLPQEGGSSLCVEFDGKKIIGNPEQRIKKIRKKNRRKLH